MLVFDAVGTFVTVRIFDGVGTIDTARPKDIVRTKDREEMLEAVDTAKIIGCCRNSKNNRYKS